MFHKLSWLILVGLTLAAPAGAEQPFRLGHFAVDASPPVGSPLAYDPTAGIQAPLSCRGLVLVGSGQPIVLCAVDWIGIGNDGNRRFREALARAAGTTVDRVAVHTLHQHDAPRCDFSTDQLLAQHGINQHIFDSLFARDVISRSAEAVAKSLRDAERVTHLGIGESRIDKVASNRRILGSDGRVEYVRYTATRDPKIRAMPVGTIDPMLKLISFYDGDRPLAVLTYYATHPQSYYRTGLANPDFPGIARNARQNQTGVLHVHFNGAGGNIGAGKWNDGSHENRQILADRVAAGMAAAWSDVRRVPISATDVGWDVESVQLPAAEHLDAAQLSADLRNESVDLRQRFAAASKLTWLLRCQSGDRIDIGCLRLGGARVLHMPGELFVEYQLAAQAERRDLFVAMAAYGDYAPGYIGTRVAYGQGGYETSTRASQVAPQVEGVLMLAIRRLLK